MTSHAFVREHDRELDELETAYRREALRLFGREREDIVKILRAAAKRGGDKQIRASLRIIQRALTAEDGLYHLRWLNAYLKLVTTTFRVGGNAIAAETGLSFKLINPRLDKAITQRAERLAGYIGAATSERVNAAVTGTLKAGGGATRIAAAIRETAYGEDISRARAQRIARTEAVGALNQGEFIRAKESKVFTEKAWLHSGNRRDPRLNHIAMDGERVGLDERFSNGLLHPGDQSTENPSETINCGCSLQFY